MFLTGSKVGLGTPWRRIRGLFGPRLGLESCWGFAVSHASFSPCFRGPEIPANRGRSRPLHGCRSVWQECLAEAQVLVFLTGSKVGLGTPWRRIRGLFGPRLGLESCWGFAVSHASFSPCFRGPEIPANRGRSRPLHGCRGRGKSVWRRLRS